MANERKYKEGAKTSPAGSTEEVVQNIRSRKLGPHDAEALPEVRELTAEEMEQKRLHDYQLFAANPKFIEKVQSSQSDAGVIALKQSLDLKLSESDLLDCLDKKPSELSRIISSKFTDITDPLAQGEMMKKIGLAIHGAMLDELNSEPKKEKQAEIMRKYEVLIENVREKLIGKDRVENLLGQKFQDFVEIPGNNFREYSLKPSLKIKNNYQLISERITEHQNDLESIDTGNVLKLKDKTEQEIHEIVRDLLDDDDYDVSLLMRKEDQIDAINKLSKIIEFSLHQELIGQTDKNAVFKQYQSLITNLEQAILKNYETFDSTEKLSKREVKVYFQHAVKRMLDNMIKFYQKTSPAQTPPPADTLKGPASAPSTPATADMVPVKVVEQRQDREKGQSVPTFQPTTPGMAPSPRATDVRPAPEPTRPGAGRQDSVHAESPAEIFETKLREEKSRLEIPVTQDMITEELKLDNPNYAKVVAMAEKLIINTRKRDVRLVIGHLDQTELSDEDKFAQAKALDTLYNKLEEKDKQGTGFRSETLFTKPWFNTFSDKFDKGGLNDHADKVKKALKKLGNEHQNTAIFSAVKDKGSSGKSK